MSNESQPAGTPAVPAAPALQPGDRVYVIAGAHLGNWGIVRSEFQPGFYWVRLDGHDSPHTIRRLIARHQLDTKIPKS